MALFQSAPHSLCILRLSAIGDVCNTIAAVQAIQRQWPQTRITWVTGKLEAELINLCPMLRSSCLTKTRMACLHSALAAIKVRAF